MSLAAQCRLKPSMCTRFADTEVASSTPWQPWSEGAPPKRPSSYSPNSTSPSTTYSFSTLWHRRQSHSKYKSFIIKIRKLHSFYFHKKVLFQNEAQPSYFFRTLRLKTFIAASYCIRIWGLTFLNLFLTWGSILAFFQAHFCIKYEFTHSNGNTVYSLFKSWQVKQKPKMQAVFFSRISTLRNWH